MIGYLTGTVVRASEKELIILTSGGVGYQVFPAGSLLAEVKEGEICSAYIYTVVKETEISLYGFGDVDEKALFQKLIGVSGVGPKTALLVVAVPLEQFLQAVDSGDVAFISKIPGFGKKTSERLILELRGKLDLTKKVENKKTYTPAMEEAEEALINLGYQKNMISRILEGAPQDSSAEDFVKFFLTSNV